MQFSSSCAAGVLTVWLLSMPALAHPDGMTGYSGKSEVTCTTCHLPGAAVPTVELSGPAVLATGETGQYTFIIRGGPARVGGANIAVSTSSASLEPVSGSGLTKREGELTHNPAPKPFSSGEVRFSFSMTAPSIGGTLTLFAAGNSANEDAGNTGDGIGNTTLDITVTGGSTPDPEPVEEEGGCAAAGGAPLLLLGVYAGGRLLRRRRS